MTKYTNGKVPASALVLVGDGNPQHKTSPYGKYVWDRLVKLVQQRHGKTLHISPGYCGYRDYAAQVRARAEAAASGNKNLAATPGTSSHGGTWHDYQYTGGRVVDAMAFDVGDWSQITWAQFQSACKAVGLIAGAITLNDEGANEPWHVVLLNPWRAVPGPLGYPAFPLKSNQYFGPALPLSNLRSVSGRFSHKSDLKRWQTEAHAKGYYNGKIDGIYGNQCKAAAQAIQRKNKITVDGLIGPNTWKRTWLGPKA